LNASDARLRIDIARAFRNDDNPSIGSCAEGDNAYLSCKNLIAGRTDIDLFKTQAYVILIDPSRQWLNDVFTRDDQEAEGHHVDLGDPV